MFSTGLRPSSVWKADGADSDWPGIQWKDVHINKKISGQYTLNIDIAHEKTSADDTNRRPVATIDSRRSPYCVVRLMITLAGLQGYYALPFAEAVASGDFTIAREFENRPLICRTNITTGQIEPEHCQTGSTNKVFDRLCALAKLPRSVVSWRSFRKGWATSLAIYYFCTAPCPTREGLTHLLITKGNWTTRTALLYVDSLLRTGFGLKLSAALDGSGHERQSVEAIRESFPYPTLAKFDYVSAEALAESYKEEVEEALNADDALQSLKQSKEACSGPEHLRLAESYSARRRTRINEMINHVNQLRLKNARMKYECDKAAFYSRDARVLDLDAIAGADSDDGNELIELWKFSTVATTEDLQDAKGAKCWACKSVLYSAGEFSEHMLTAHGTAFHAQCPEGCKSQKSSFDVFMIDGELKKDYYGRTVSLLSAISAHCRDAHHCRFKCPRCNTDNLRGTQRNNACVDGAPHGSLVDTAKGRELLLLREDRPCSHCASICKRVRRTDIPCITDAGEVFNRVTMAYLKGHLCAQTHREEFTNSEFRDAAYALMKKDYCGEESWQLPECVQNLIDTHFPPYSNA